MLLLLALVCASNPRALCCSKLVAIGVAFAGIGGRGCCYHGTCMSTHWHAVCEGGAGSPRQAVSVQRLELYLHPTLFRSLLKMSTKWHAIHQAQANRPSKQKVWSEQQPRCHPEVQRACRPGPSDGRPIGLVPGGAGFGGIRGIVARALAGVLQQAGPASAQGSEEGQVSMIVCYAAQPALRRACCQLTVATAACLPHLVAVVMQVGRLLVRLAPAWGARQQQGVE